MIPFDDQEPLKTIKSHKIIYLYWKDDFKSKNLSAIYLALQSYWIRTRSSEIMKDEKIYRLALTIVITIKAEELLFFDGGLLSLSH